MKKYFVWKDANCNGINPEWLEISGKEFHKIVSDPENKRWFIKWYDEDGECPDVFWYEVTYRVYLDHKEQKAREAYRRKKFFDENTLIVDFEEVLYYDDDGPVTRADTIVDEDAYVEPNPEEQLILDLQEALKTLSQEERELIDLLFLKNDDHKSERQIAKELGIPDMTINSRKKKIMQKLRLAFVQNGNFSGNSKWRGK